MEVDMIDHEQRVIECLGNPKAASGDVEALIRETRINISHLDKEAHRAARAGDGSGVRGST
jgi:hypothetical protein